ncbi:MAG: hypothetical protein HC835_18725 [Oscillatoriales cyanobacterium RM2_1_1]|nr:hypothetical protein [Oscillatoriales cyanobacterium SM2_3_0]NJO47473.1 hypothetical protein [Oscillatoriales cyanobacterium RM2_1_1]
MEEFSQGFFAAVEAAFIEFDKFLKVAGEELQAMADELEKASDEVTQELQERIIPGLDEYFAEIIEPVLDVYFNLDLDLTNEGFEPFVSYVHPSRTQNPACQGCSNYHGQVYGGNLLVCAIHPTGVEAETCPDWEQSIYQV